MFFVFRCCCSTIASAAIAFLSRGLTLKTYVPALRGTFDFLTMSKTDLLSEPGNDILVFLSPKSTATLKKEHNKVVMRLLDVTKFGQYYNY